MADALRHRGPDDAGVWVDAKTGLALGHRRLSVLDLSLQGHQPMVSRCGDFVIAFNGEIYNFREIRAQLDADQPHVWHGHSDTEVLLECCARWGVEKAVKLTVGMFSFALWDRQRRILTLARDRLGEKPLYYGWHSGAFYFASELKAITAHPNVAAEIDRNALTLFLRHNYVPDPQTIYRGIFKLMPGTLLTLSPDTVGSGKQTRYWSAQAVAEDGQRQTFKGTFDEAVQELDLKLRRTVKGQMLSDVPLGAFLSGGIDSTVIVALMQAQSRRPVQTFTIGFWEKNYNEAQFAKAVAAHLGTQHTELYITEQDALNIVPQLPEIYDEPFADSSQIPTYLVSRLARRSVTVTLSGDGGDELFGGYNRYFWAARLWRTLRVVPLPIRAGLGGLVRCVAPGTWNKLFDLFGYFLPKQWRYRNAGDKLHKLAEIVAAKCPVTIYDDLVSHWKRPAEVVIGAQEPATVISDPAHWPAVAEFEHQMMYVDTVSYLPGDILTKLDRATMRVGLEGRVPFLDHRIVEFAWRLPLSMKVDGRQGKRILRNMLGRYVPEGLIDRPKMGFGVPLDSWLRGPLRPWVEAMLDQDRLRHEGYFHIAPIRAKWMEHLSGERNWAYYLWDVLMFQAWLEKSRP